MIDDFCTTYTPLCQKGLLPPRHCVAMLLAMTAKIALSIRNLVPSEPLELALMKRTGCDEGKALVPNGAIFADPQQTAALAPAALSVNAGLLMIDCQIAALTFQPGNRQRFSRASSPQAGERFGGQVNSVEVWSSSLRRLGFHARGHGGNAMAQACFFCMQGFWGSATPRGEKCDLSTFDAPPRHQPDNHSSVIFSVRAILSSLRMLTESTNCGREFAVCTPIPTPNLKLFLINALQPLNQCTISSTP